MKNHEWLPRYPKDELTGPQFLLTCEAEGLMNRYRDFSWINGGIPVAPGDDPLHYLRNFAKRCGISNYKFKKIWATIENFFSISEGCFVYPEDELRRAQKVEMVAKRKIAGELGAMARWRGRVVPIAQPMGTGMANGMANASESHAIPDPEIHTKGVQYNTPSAAAEKPPGAVCDAPPVSQTMETKQETEQPGEAVAAIRRRATDLGLPIPAKKFAKRIREKFLHVPISEMLESLVRWEGQRSVGMWEQMSAEDFRTEARRQRTAGAGAPRKPSQRQLDDAELMRRAHARDQAAAKGAHA